MIQYIVVGIIGLVCLFIIGRAIYRLFTPQSNSSACGGCKACNIGKEHQVL